jgi:hypothetical protein
MPFNPCRTLDRNDAFSANRCVIESLELRRLCAVFSGADALVQPEFGPYGTRGSGSHPLDAKFVLIDDHGVELATFGTGAVINLRKYGENLNVLARSALAPHSVRFGHNGAANVSIVSEPNPFVLFHAPNVLELGEHTVQANLLHRDAHTEAVTVQFTVVDEPFQIPGGRLVAPAASVEFGDVPIGESMTRPVMITNPSGPGERTITIDGTTIYGYPMFTDDITDDLVDIVLQPGESRTINVTFSPRAEQREGQTLRMQYKGSNQFLAVVLSGGGTAAAPGASWSVPDQIQHTVAPNGEGGRLVTVTWHTAEPDAPSRVVWWQASDAIFDGNGGVITSTGPGGASHRATFNVWTNEAYVFRILGKGDAFSDITYV